MPINRQQPMRPALLDTMNAVDAFEAQTVPNGSITNEKLSTELQQAMSFLSTVPEFEFGTSNSISVPANSQATVDITFSAKTETPIVFTSLQYTPTSGQLMSYVSTVSNTQASIVLVNLTQTDADNVTVDWLTISGR